jgi:hypothetical protein
MTASALTRSVLFNPLQRKMLGHGALMLLVAMLAGVGLLLSVLGGLELWPGHVLPVDMPSNPAGWVRTHVGGLLNGMLVMLIALLLQGLGFADAAARRIALFMIGTGWANTLFYWAAMWAPNRALTFGDNRLGASNAAAVLGLAPALLFVLLSLVAVAWVARQAFRPLVSSH